MGLFSKLFGSQPDSAEAFIQRGLGYLEKGQYDKAVADFNEAIRLEPEIPGTFAARGQAYFAKEMLDQAVSPCGSRRIAAL